MSKASESKAARKVGPIVSSAHLVSAEATELSEFEFGLMTAYNGLQRWIVRGMAASGCPDLSALDVMVIHTVNHRERPKKLADICLVLNIEDTHNVNYALKKLIKAGLVSRRRAGKENVFETTREGRAACERYREIREALLIESFTRYGEISKEVGDLAGLLRTLSGLYDQAARAATSL